MRATSSLALVLAAGGFVAFAAPVCADHLRAAPSAEVQGDRAHGTGAARFEAADVLQSVTRTPIDPALALALVMVVPSGTASMDMTAGGSTKAPVKEQTATVSSSDTGGTAPGTSSSPEPATLVTAVLGAGLAGWAACARRRNRPADGLRKAPFTHPMQ